MRVRWKSATQWAGGVVDAGSFTPRATVTRLAFRLSVLRSASLAVGLSQCQQSAMCFHICRPLRVILWLPNWHDANRFTDVAFRLYCEQPTSHPPRSLSDPVAARAEACQRFNTIRRRVDHVP